MDENEFRQLLDLFPVVRSPDYHADVHLTYRAIDKRSLLMSDVHFSPRSLIDLGKPLLQAASEFSGQLSGSSPSQEVKEWQDSWSTDNKNEAFWGKLKAAAEQKVGAADAERFCKAFQQVYKKLVYEELTTDAARRIINSRTP